MTNRRFQTEFSSWKNDERSSSRSSFTDRQISTNLSNAVTIDRHLRVRPYSQPTQPNSRSSLQENRLKREILREVHQRIPLTLKIGIPAEKNSERNKRKLREKEEQQNRKFDEIEINFRQMKIQMEEQNEKIENLKTKIDDLSKPVVQEIKEEEEEEILIPKSIIRPKPFCEELPVKNLRETIWN